VPEPKPSNAARHEDARAGATIALEASKLLRGLLSRVEAGLARGRPLDPTPVFLTSRHLTRILSWTPHTCGPSKTLRPQEARCAGKEEQQLIEANMVEAVLLVPPRWLIGHGTDGPDTIYVISAWLLGACWDKGGGAGGARNPALLVRAVWWIAGAAGAAAPLRTEIWARASEARSLFRALLLLVQRPPVPAALRPAVMALVAVMMQILQPRTSSPSRDCLHSTPGPHSLGTADSAIERERLLTVLRALADHLPHPIAAQRFAAAVHVDSGVCSESSVTRSAEAALALALRCVASGGSLAVLQQLAESLDPGRTGDKRKSKEEGIGGMLAAALAWDQDLNPHKSKKSKSQ
jgi:hypothetical protein